ncbi:hypothetical protein [Ehrlichia ruminantium]|nr:hypothetical protein [Ehrlichia ruminantium]UOD99740.1 hypothetical protein IMW62_00280 [Ehrlichia ruminantium]
MILQVHDKLLFEVPEDHVDNTVKLIKKVMEGIVNYQTTQGRYNYR